MRAWFTLFAASLLVAGCGARTGLPINGTGADQEGAGGDPIDAGPDVVTDCTDAGITYVYLISSENKLLRFYPPDLSVVTIGTINCLPTTPGAAPFSMAVNREGIAYVIFSDGELFRVSTLTAACKPTGFVAGQQGFPGTFGMGFAANDQDPGETLFVVGDDTSNSGAPSVLATIDLTTFELATVSNLSLPIGKPELTGTGDARLFGFGPDTPFSHVAEIDRTTAVIKSDALINLDMPSFSAWAFAFWGGDFYIFTSLGAGTSVVHRYTPGGPTEPPQVAVLDGVTIVGAGVSTCAPSE